MSNPFSGGKGIAGVAKASGGHDFTKEPTSNGGGGGRDITKENRAQKAGSDPIDNESAPDCCPECLGQPGKASVTSPVGLPSGGKVPFKLNG